MEIKLIPWRLPEINNTFCLFLKRVKQYFFGNFNLDNELIKKKQKCFELNCPSDKFDLSQSEIFQEKKSNKSEFFIDF